MEPMMMYLVAQAEHKARVAYLDKYGHHLVAPAPARTRRRRLWSWRRPRRGQAIVPAFAS